MNFRDILSTDKSVTDDRIDESSMKYSKENSDKFFEMNSERVGQTAVGLNGSELKNSIVLLCSPYLKRFIMKSGKNYQIHMFNDLEGTYDVLDLYDSELALLKKMK